MKIFLNILFCLLGNKAKRSVEVTARNANQENPKRKYVNENGGTLGSQDPPGSSAMCEIQYEPKT